jgi:hypothetical protein
MDANSCFACVFGSIGGNMCDGGADDGICEADEDSTTCPDDCP